MSRTVPEGGGVIADAKVTLAGRKMKTALSKQTGTDGQISWEEEEISFSSNELKVGDKITIEVQRKNYNFESQEFTIDQSNFTQEITLTRGKTSERQ